MKKNLEIDVPKDAETEVQRVRGLKKSIFMRTRIALLSLVLVLGLSVASTFAYYSWTANQTPNRASAGEIGFSIVENNNESETETINTNATGVYYGSGNKKVKLRADDSVDIAKQRVRVSFLPERVSKERDETETTAYASEYLNGDWSASVQETKDDSDNVTAAWIECDDIKLYINPEWSKEWTYSGGSFTRIESLERGKDTGVLLLGMEMLTANSSYQEVKVNVIAEAIQENTDVDWAQIPSSSSDTTTDDDTTTGD